MRLLALGRAERRSGRLTHVLALLATELVAWTIAAHVAGSISGRVGRALDVMVDLPSPPLSDRDLSLTILMLVSVHAGIHLIAHRTLGCEVRISARCMAQELHLGAIALAVAAIGVFLFTDIVFNAHWFAAVGLVFAPVMILVFGVLHWARRPPGGPGVTELAQTCLRLLASPLGIAALSLVVASFASAKLYRVNEDFANAVTRLRLLLNTDDDLRPWALVDGYPNASFLQPMLLRFRAGEPGVAYLLERQGRLLRIDLAGEREPEVVLDFRRRVGRVEIENGALGFALPPSSGGRNRDGLVYVYYTDVHGERQVNRVSSFDLSLADAAARLASEHVLIELNRDASGFHNGGGIEFGPDGHLYIAVGEATDQRNHQTIRRSLFGGILRIDVETGDANGHPPIRQPEDGRTAGYHIPNDNPFVGQAGVLEEFYAIGVRNPFRMSFDPATGALWAGDVGSSHLEEVNHILKGGNYQFPFAEGDRPMGRRPERVIGREMPPVYAYQHTAYERSIIGGLVYRGERHPVLVGKYLFADNYSGHVYALDIASGETAPPIVLARSPDVAQRGITSLTTGPDGAILLTTLGDDKNPTGRILELVPADEAVSTAGARLLEARADQPVDCAQAEAHYRQYCARCHGLSGTGNGSEAESLEGLILPDFTDPGWQSRWTDEGLRRVIRDGGEASGLSAYMPPWQDILTPPAIEAVASYLRRIARGGRCPIPKA